MANLQIGDKVRVIGLTEDDCTGVIVAKGDKPDVASGEVVPGKELEPEIQISWWKVKLDGTGEIREFPIDRLKKAV